MKKSVVILCILYLTTITYGMEFSNSQGSSNNSSRELASSNTEEEKKESSDNNITKLTALYTFYWGSDSSKEGNTGAIPHTFWSDIKNITKKTFLIVIGLYALYSASSYISREPSLSQRIATVNQDMATMLQGYNCATPYPYTAMSSNILSCPNLSTSLKEVLIKHRKHILEKEIDPYIHDIFMQYLISKDYVSAHNLLMASRTLLVKPWPQATRAKIEQIVQDTINDLLNQGIQYEESYLPCPWFKPDRKAIWYITSIWGLIKNPTKYYSLEENQVIKLIQDGEEIETITALISQNAWYQESQQKIIEALQMHHPDAVQQIIDLFKYQEMETLIE